jgi:hypothetical protein
MISFARLGVIVLFAAGAVVACGEDADTTGASGGTTASSSAGGSSSSTSASSSVTSSSSGATTATSTASSGSGGGVPSSYPAGPYGVDVGDTFPYLTWAGYLSTDAAALATAESWTDSYTSLDLMNSGAPYAVVHTTLTT